MTAVLDRIAHLRARFETLAPAARAANTVDFSSLLEAAKTSNGTSVSSTLGATSGADTSGFSSMSRLALANTSAPATGAIGVTKARSGLAAVPVPASFADYSKVIGEIATAEGVPASLLGALVWSESGFNPDAVSGAGARGLAQLMPATAAGLGVDIDDPVDNLRGGARYLRQMLDRFGSTELALAAYNAGPNAVIRAGGVPAYEETRNYVTRVTARAATLAGGQQ